MKITFRLECPYCRQSHEWSNNYVNMGWIALRCTHCFGRFFAKVSIPIVNTETAKSLLEDIPCQTMEM